MLSQFQASYQRLEQSLQKLTDSIAAYNPSPSAADEVVLADEVVNADLEDLIIHQTNYQRILHLREIAASLDETIKKTVQDLADARRNILAIPAARSNDDRDGGDVRREVNIDEALSYAKFISRTTVPPSFRREDVPSFPPTSSRSKVNATGATTNGEAGSPNTGDAAEGHDNATTVVHSTEVADSKDKSDDNAVDNNDATMAYLDQELPFEPWPSQAHLQMGVLGDIQRIIESGRDPASVLTEEEQAAEDARRKEAEERERIAVEEAERRRMSMFDTGGSTGGTLRRRETAGDVFNPDDL